MKNQSKIAALLAAGFVLGTGGVSFAQTSTSGTGGKVVSPPSSTTGSGKDTGMNVPSGMSGNGPNGTGLAGHGTSPSRTNSSSGRKKSHHGKKKS